MAHFDDGNMKYVAYVKEKMDGTWGNWMNWMEIALLYFAFSMRVYSLNSIVKASSFLALFTVT